MESQADGELHDLSLSEEIRLLGAFVLAAAGTTRHLTAEEVDEVLQSVDASHSHEAEAPRERDAAADRDSA